MLTEAFSIQIVMRTKRRFPLAVSLMVALAAKALGVVLTIGVSTHVFHLFAVDNLVHSLIFH